MADTDDALVTKVSPWSVTETVARLRAVIAARRMRVAALIDVGADACAAGFTARETTLVRIGDPALTAPLIAAAPLSALDLPPAVVVWADALETKVSYLAPRAFADRYDIAVELTDALACIADIVDVVIDR